MGRNANGEAVNFISSSEKSVRKANREQLRRNEYLAPGNDRDPTHSRTKDHFHHAESSAVMAMVSSGYDVVALFPSRKACPLCRQMRVELGLTIPDPD